MNTSDKLHDLLADIYRRALQSGDYTYVPYAIRIDFYGWQILINSQKAFEDGSFDRFAHRDKFKWRGLERITVHALVGMAGLHDAKGMDDPLPCEMLCIETRQGGEHGRRKYFDATQEELDAIFGGE